MKSCEKNSVIRFVVNGKTIKVMVNTKERALDVIRDKLGLKGTKEGCGIGECGACTIIVDEKSVNACLMLGVQLDGREVLTAEGLNSNSKLHPLQAALLENHAVQCGFCTPGVLMSAHALLSKNLNVTPEMVSRALSGNLCRCTGYRQIQSAIEDAAERLKKEKK